MKNVIDSQVIYLDPKKAIKDQLAAIELLFGPDTILMAERGFESADGPVFGNCIVSSLKNKYFSYYTDGNHYHDGLIAKTTFYVVSGAPF